MPFRWMDNTITVLRPSKTEERGVEVSDWDNPAKHEVAGCSVQPASTSREFGGRVAQVVDGWTLIAPPDADVAEGDRVEFGGRAYEIDGAPYRWDSPTGRVSSLQAHLVDWRG